MKRKGSNIARIRKLEQEIQSLKIDLWNLVGGGEFAAWLETKSMPLAAAKELEDARRHFESIQST